MAGYISRYYNHGEYMSNSITLNQHGISLIEVCLALSFSAVLFASGVYYINSYKESKRLKIDAEQFLELTRAAEGYAKSRQLQLLSSSAPEGIAVNGFKKISLNDLKDGGFLRTDYPATLGSTNQQFEVMLQHIQTNQMASQNRNLRKLAIWIFTSNGDSYTQKEVSEIVKTLGSEAGYTLSNNKLIEGVGSAWTAVNDINLKPGHPVIRLTSTQLSSLQNKKWAWVNVLGSRQSGRHYRNSSGEPMMISVHVNNHNSMVSFSKCSLIFTGIEPNLKRSHSNCAITNGGGHSRSSFFLVEARKSYAFAAKDNPDYWYEYKPVGQ